MRLLSMEYVRVSAVRCPPLWCEGPTSAWQALMRTRRMSEEAAHASYALATRYDSKAVMRSTYEIDES